MYFSVTDFKFIAMEFLLAQELLRIWRQVPGGQNREILKGLDTDNFRLICTTGENFGQPELIGQAENLVLPWIAEIGVNQQSLLMQLRKDNCKIGGQVTAARIAARGGQAESLAPVPEPSHNEL